MTLLVRSWNIFHGRTFPETRTAYPEQAVALITAGAPDVVCLQEVPVWALRRLEAWSGMRAYGAVTMRALGGPAARRLTELDPGRLRSALTGQANAILVSGRLEIGERRRLVLNPRAFRRQETRREGLPRRVQRAWGRNRRLAQLVRIGWGGGSAVVVNAHLTSHPDSRPADCELRRLATLAEEVARPREPILLCGDLNLTAASSRVLSKLGESGFSSPCAGIDHILVRGLAITRGPEAWPDERRSLGELVLSDHAPLEVEVIPR